MLNVGEPKVKICEFLMKRHECGDVRLRVGRLAATSLVWAILVEMLVTNRHSCFVRLQERFQLPSLLCVQQSPNLSLQP